MILIETNDNGNCEDNDNDGNSNDNGDDNDNGETHDNYDNNDKNDSATLRRWCQSIPVLLPCWVSALSPSQWKQWSRSQHVQLAISKHGGYAVYIIDEWFPSNIHYLYAFYRWILGFGDLISGSSPPCDFLTSKGWDLVVQRFSIVACCFRGRLYVCCDNRNDWFLELLGLGSFCFLLFFLT